MNPIDKMILKQIESATGTNPDNTGITQAEISLPYYKSIKCRRQQQWYVTRTICNWQHRTCHTTVAIYLLAIKLALNLPKIELPTYQEHLVFALWRVNHGYALAKSDVLDTRLQPSGEHLLSHLHNFKIR